MDGMAPGKRARSAVARKARTLMSQEGMFPAGSRALVMVSGGQDSLALLHLLADRFSGPPGPAHIHALHVNHHLRGQESEEDEALVTRVCADLEVSLTVVHRSIEKGTGGVQESARIGRREAALHLAQEHECARIALGHTADDQVETMLYRLGRYGGLAAFRAMRPCEPPWVRPLLGCRREETAAYCLEEGLEFAEDRGNLHPGYARTGIREGVIPTWEAVLPGAVEAAARAAEVAAEMEALAADALADAGVRLGHPDVAKAKRLSATGLLQLPAAQRRLLLHRWLEVRASVVSSRATVLALEALLAVPGSGECTLAGDWHARKEYDAVWLEKGARIPPAVPAPVPLPVPGEAEWAGVRIRAEQAERYCAPDPMSEAYVDARALQGPLLVRGPRAGDRLRPLGAPGTRKLQDVLVDLRVPAADRALVPLVLCGDRVVWMCGLVVAEEGRIRADTTAIVRLSASSSADGLAPPHPTEEEAAKS